MICHHCPPLLRLRGRADHAFNKVVHAFQRDIGFDQCLDLRSRGAARIVIQRAFDSRKTTCHDLGLHGFELGAGRIRHGGPNGDILIKPSARPPRTKLSIVPPSSTVWTMPV